MASIQSTAQQQARASCEGGRAQPTLCLHCSTGSSRQWRSLTACLGDHHRVIAPDLLGYGDNPPWPRTRGLRLDTEVRRLHRLIASTPRPVDVVAHSFGGAVAVKLALAYPHRVRSLCLYEPVLFGLLRGDADSSAALRQIHMKSAQIAAALSHGHADAAARHFIDFWSGDGTWECMPESRREDIRARIGKVCADFEALLADKTTLSELEELEIPVLCLSGAHSPPATRRVADLLASTMPLAKNKRFENAGHMGPLTHAREVNACIARFLCFLSAQQCGHTPHTLFAARAA